MADLAVTVTRVEGLGEKQEAAFAALRSGGSFAQAAQAAGVARITIYRWVQNDPNFRAAYNAWQQELVESARARLLKLTDTAVNVVEKALERDDEKVAVGVLRHMGVLRDRRAGTTDPQLLARKMDLRKRRREFAADEEMVRHLLAKLGLSPAKQRKYLRQHGVGGAMLQLGGKRPTPSAAGGTTEGRRGAGVEAIGEPQDHAPPDVAQATVRGERGAAALETAPPGPVTTHVTNEGL